MASMFRVFCVLEIGRQNIINGKALGTNNTLTLIFFLIVRYIFFRDRPPNLQNTIQSQKHPHLLIIKQ